MNKFIVSTLITAVAVSPIALKIFEVAVPAVNIFNASFWVQAATCLGISLAISLIVVGLFSWLYSLNRPNTPPIKQFEIRATVKRSFGFAVIVGCLGGLAIGFCLSGGLATKMLVELLTNVIPNIDLIVNQMPIVLNILLVLVVFLSLSIISFLFAEALQWCLGVYSFETNSILEKITANSNLNNPTADAIFARNDRELGFHGISEDCSKKNSCQ